MSTNQTGDGSRIVKTEPWPTSLCTPRRAPCRSAICLAIVKPSPVPPDSLDRTLSARQKRSKMCGRSSGEIPAPVSATEIVTPVASTLPESVKWPPEGVYLSALSIRMTRSCRSCCSSALTDSTGRVVRITRFADSSLAQRLRGLVRFALTGAEGVLAGQVVAAVAFAGGVLLVWTGLSLALGRLRRLRSRRYENCAVDQFLSGSTNRASTVILIGVSFCLNAVSDSASMVFRLASMP